MQRTVVERVRRELVVRVRGIGLCGPQRNVSHGNALHTIQRTKMIRTDRTLNDAPSTAPACPTTMGAPVLFAFGRVEFHAARVKL